MNDIIGIPGGTAIVGMYSIDFSVIEGPIVVVAGYIYLSKKTICSLVASTHLGHVYLESIFLDDFLELLKTKTHIRVAELSVVHYMNEKRLAESLLATRCTFSVAATFSSRAMGIMSHLKGQTAVRAYKVGDGSDGMVPMVLLTNDPDVDLRSWDFSIVFKSNDTLVFRGNHCILFDKYDGDAPRNQVVIHETCYLQGIEQLSPCKELHLYMQLRQDIPTAFLNRRYKKIVLHLVHANLLGDFTVERLHPDTQSVQIHGCNEDTRVALEQRCNEMAVLALCSLDMPHIAEKSPLIRVPRVLIREVAQMLNL
jgi:hypothetical protein